MTALLCFIAILQMPDVNEVHRRLSEENECKLTMFTPSIICNVAYPEEDAASIA